MPQDPTQRSVKCPYCNTTAIVPETLREEASAKETVTTTSHSQTIVIQTPERRRSSGGCSLFFLVLLFGLGAGAYYLFANQGSLEGPAADILSQVSNELSNTNLNGPALLLPSDDASAHIAFTSYNFTQEVMMVNYLNTDNTLLWQSDTFADELGSTFLAADGQHVYYLNETDLTALNKATGQTVWQATVSDKQAPNCQQCTMSFGTVLLILTNDNTLQALDTTSGEQLWQQQFGNPIIRRLFRLGEAVGLMNEVEETGVGFALLNPSTGEEIQRLNPRCNHPSFGAQEPSITDPVFVDETETAVYFIFGFFDPPCVQQWDYTTGVQTWNTFLETGFSIHDVVIVQDGRFIYYNADNHTIYKTDKTSGETALLITDENYDFIPLEAGNNILLTQAVRRLGTTRDELWGIDSDGTGPLWQHVPQATEILEPAAVEVIYSRDEGFWFTSITPAGVHLLQARHNPPRLVLETLNVRDGSSNGQTDVALNIPSSDTSYWFTLIGEHEQTLWLEVDLDHIIAVDWQTATIESRWP